MLFTSVLPPLNIWFDQAELQKLEQQKQQSVDEMRDRKTYMERTVEMKRDEPQKKQQELKNITEELQRLQDPCSRLQELENKLAEVVRMHTHMDHDVFEVVKSSQVDFFDILFFWRETGYIMCVSYTTLILLFYSLMYLTTDSVTAALYESQFKSVLLCLTLVSS